MWCGVLKLIAFCLCETKMLRVFGSGNSILYCFPNIKSYCYVVYSTRETTSRLRCRHKDCRATCVVENISLYNGDETYGTVMSGGEGVHERHNHLGTDNLADNLNLKAYCRKRSQEESIPYRDIYLEACDR